MSKFLYLLFFTIITIELFNKFNCAKKLNKFFILYIKLIKTIASKKISPHWKVKVIFIYIRKIIYDGIIFIFILLLLSLLFFLISEICPEFINLMFSILGVILTSITMMLYLYARKIILK